MSRKTVYIVVEGATEQTFIRDVLAPEMSAEGIDLSPKILGKKGHKGGNVSIERAKIDIRKFLKQRKDTYVSTMFDYFGIDSKWPGFQKVNRKLKEGTGLSPSEKADFLEKTTSDLIANEFEEENVKERFIPYISMHEFEALLFSNPEVLSDELKVKKSCIDKILASHENDPEQINNDPSNAPSKLLEGLCEGYQKVAQGKAISEAIGIQEIRKRCTHFNEWLEKLEAL